MKPARRHLFIAGLAALLGVLILFAPDDELSLPAKKGGGASPGVRTPLNAERSSAATRRVAMPQPGDGSLKSVARSVPENVPDLFRAFSWYVPPPPPPPPPVQPPPPPEAPPLPFVYMGQYIEDDHQLLILSRGNRVLTVAVGDVIANTYRVDSFTGGAISFTYLPLNITQTLKAGIQ